MFVDADFDPAHQFWEEKAQQFLAALHIFTLEHAGQLQAGQPGHSDLPAAFSCSRGAQPLLLFNSFPCGLEIPDASLKIL